MGFKKVDGMTIYTEDGYFPKEVVDEINKRYAEEKAKKSTKEPATKSTKKPAKKK